MGVWHNTGQTRGWSWFTATKPVRAYLYGQPPLYHLSVPNIPYQGGLSRWANLWVETGWHWFAQKESQHCIGWKMFGETRKGEAKAFWELQSVSWSRWVTAVWWIGLILLSYLKNILSNLIVTSNGRDISSWHHTSVSTYLAWFNTIACSTHCSVDNLLFLLRRSSYCTRSPPLVASGWLAQIKMVDLHW